MLVCAAHPQLREAARSVRDRVGQDCLPGRNIHLAAVHARGRRLDEVVASVARQLGLSPPTEGVWTAAGLVEALSRRDVSMPAPVIVIDALDEADDPKDIQDLLLPLARAATSWGADRMACRLLVGTRPWPQFAALLQAARDDGELLDLDTVDAVQLASDLAAYVQRLLATSRLYDAAGMRGLRKDLAEAVADVLAANSVHGAFLVAALYTHHLLSLDAAVADPARVRDEVPRTPGAMLELHLRYLDADAWLRPVLAAIAHAKDQGMPSRLLRVVACVFRARPAEGDVEPSVDEMAVVLDSVRFYLRRSVDVDGTTLYRLFHQGLADHLRQYPLSAQEPVS